MFYGLKISFLLSLIIFFYYVSFIDRAIFNDVTRYFLESKRLNQFGFFDAISNNNWEILSNIYLYLISFLKFEIEFFSLLTIIFMWIFLYLTLKVVIPYNFVYVFLFGFFCFFYFYNFNTNIYRQGYSALFLLLMVNLLIKKKPLLSFISLFFAINFHLTGVIGIYLYFLLYFKVSIRKLIILLLFSQYIFLSNTNLLIYNYLQSVPFFQVFISRMMFFVNSNVIQDYGGVNRLDFFIFNNFWIIISLYFHIRNKNNFILHQYTKAFIGFTIVFFIFGFIAYSDRIASYSWMLIPIIVWIHIIDGKKLKIKFIQSIVLTIIYFLAYNFQEYLIF
jgi:hypothetical protein